MSFCLLMQNCIQTPDAQNNLKTLSPHSVLVNISTGPSDFRYLTESCQWQKTVRFRTCQVSFGKASESFRSQRYVWKPSYSTVHNYGRTVWNRSKEDKQISVILPVPNFPTYLLKFCLHLLQGQDRLGPRSIQAGSSVLTYYVRRGRDVIASIISRHDYCTFLPRLHCRCGDIWAAAKEGYC